MIKKFKLKRRKVFSLHCNFDFFKRIENVQLGETNG